MVEIGSSKCKGPEARRHPMCLKSCNENSVWRGRLCKEEVEGETARCDGEPGFYAKSKRAKEHWRVSNQQSDVICALKSSPWLLRIERKWRWLLGGWVGVIVVPEETH